MICLLLCSLIHLPQVLTDPNFIRTLKEYDKDNVPPKVRGACTLVCHQRYTRQPSAGAGTPEQQTCSNVQPGCQAPENLT